MKFKKWMEKFHERITMDATIPYIQFPKKWEIAIIPPLRDTWVRFKVRKKGQQNHIIVTLECYSRTGHRYKIRPYWELYPSKKGFPIRYAMRDIRGLISGIRESIKKLK